MARNVSKRFFFVFAILCFDLIVFNGILIFSDIFKHQLWKFMSKSKGICVCTAYFEGEAEQYFVIPRSGDEQWLTNRDVR